MNEAHPLSPATHVNVDPQEVIPTLKQHMQVDGFDFVLDLERSQGSWLIDARNGKKYLDLFTFFASNPIGMNHPKMTDRSFVEKIGQAAIHKPSNSDIYTVAMAEFVETFFRLAVPDEFQYAFFIEGGALAVENAMKVAFDWKVRKNWSNGESGEVGQQILHFERAFHGRSGYTMSLTNTVPDKVALFPKFDWPRVPSPSAVFPLENENLKVTVERENEAIKAIEAAFAERGSDIAAIVIEPIQGEGGDNHFRTEFLSKLREICDREEAMLIFDEVQTGVALTGTMWAYQGIGVQPDILCFGKKSQVCGILVGERVDEVEENVFHKPSRINSTWGGNLVDMIRFTRFLEIIDEERLVVHAREMGSYLLDELRDLSSDFPKLVQNVRGRGLMCAFDLDSTERRNDVRTECYENGLMILGSGKRAIRFRPPLNISQEEIDFGIEVIRNALSTVGK